MMAEGLHVKGRRATQDPDACMDGAGFQGPNIPLSERGCCCCNPTHESLTMGRVGGCWVSQGVSEERKGNVHLMTESDSHAIFRGASPDVRGIPRTTHLLFRWYC
jgi:hypothetical protein